MKITNVFFEQNITRESPLIKLCQCAELPTKISYWLSRLLSHLESLNKTYADEKRKLLEKWCDKGEEGKPIILNDQYQFSEHVNEFNAEYKELLEIELDIDMKEIAIPLEKIPPGVLNSYDFSQLKGLIEFKEE